MYGKIPLLSVIAMPALAAAQLSTVPLAQWQHTLLNGDAAPPGPGGDFIRRSPDGYLWVNGYNGLMRFDGVRFTLLDSATVPELGGTAGYFNPRLVDTSRTMWVEGPNGKWLTYREGKFQIGFPTGSGVRRIEMDGSGRLWAIAKGIHLIVDGQLRPAPLPPGVPQTDLTSIKRDTGSGIWIGTNRNGLWHVSGSTAKQYARGRVQPLGQTSDGTFWATVEANGMTVSRLVNGKWEEVRGPNGERIVLRDIREGPDGSVWLPTNTLGVLRWRNGAVERFARRDGLSSDMVNGLFVAEEGTVWVGTAAGFDRLRPSAFVAIDARDGFPDNARPTFVTDAGGGIWIQTQSDSVLLLDGGAIRGAPGRLTIAQAFPGPASGAHNFISPSHAGGVWVAAAHGGLVRYSTRGMEVVGPEAGLPNERIDRGVETRDGSLWVQAFAGEFGRLRGGRYREMKFPNGRVDQFTEDDAGRLWIMFGATNSLLQLEGDSIVAEVKLPVREPVNFRSLAVESGDTLWLAGANQLFRIARGQAVHVRAPALTRLFPLGTRLAITAGHLWTAGAAGVARVRLSTLHRIADGESLAIEPEVFGELDGIPAGRIAEALAYPIRIGSGGRVWITTTTGLAVMAPSGGSVNSVAPEVHVEGVSVGGTLRTASDGAEIPPNPNRVAIRFSAPMFGLPERGRVEHRLDGADDHWVTSKPPFVAEYNQLRPGRYRFRVRAWNENGVPSAHEATLSFRVLPAWYQAWWFFGLGIAVIAALSGGTVAAVQRRRSRRAASDAQSRFDAVLAERTRMARELHDTLLQGFTGITLQLDSVRDSLEARAEPAAKALGNILVLADRTLREAREMVWDIREPAADITDLNESLRVASYEITQPAGVELIHSVDGVSRQLAPVVVGTVLRIAKEAVVNAVKHARPTSITVRLIYELRGVVLEVLDDGIGCDPVEFDAATARGHWGIAGMRERARAVGGDVELTSAPGKGTRIRVSIPTEPAFSTVSPAG